MEASISFGKAWLVMLEKFKDHRPFRTFKKIYMGEAIYRPQAS